MDIHENTVVVNGINTHYYNVGDKGSVIVLLHGGGTDSAKLSWGEVMLPLAESGHRVIAPDMPGYGGSERPDIPSNTAFYLDFLKAFLVALKLDKVSLMGLSMGGGIALGYTLTNPQQVERLVLVDSYGIQRKVAMHFLSWLLVKIPGIMETSVKWMKSSRSMIRWSMSSIMHDTKNLSEELLDELMAESSKPFAGRAFTSYQRDEVFANSLKTVYIDRLNEIKIPTLIVHGEFDTGVPLACAREANRLIAGSKLEVIPGAGHWPQREKPVEFEKVIVPFLKDR
jgi:pimeloyl-ACP methyl ester carboxylesterase